MKLSEHLFCWSETGVVWRWCENAADCSVSDWFPIWVNLTESLLRLAQALLIGGVNDVDHAVRFCIVLKQGKYNITNRLVAFLSSEVDLYNSLFNDSIRITLSERVSPCPTKTVVLLVLQDPKTSGELFPHQWCRLKQTGKTSKTTAMFVLVFFSFTGCFTHCWGRQ